MNVTEIEDLRYRIEYVRRQLQEPLHSPVAGRHYRNAYQLALQLLLVELGLLYTVEYHEEA